MLRAALHYAAAASSKTSSTLSKPLSLIARSLTTTVCSPAAAQYQPSCNKIKGPATRGGALLASPWSLRQLRHAAFSGAEQKPGNVIERKGKVYKVVKAQQTPRGKRGTVMQVELREVYSGNTISEKLSMDESIEQVLLQENCYSYLYTDDDDDTVVLMVPSTYAQINVPKDLFGASDLSFFEEDMGIAMKFYDGIPMSASISEQVTCTVAETDNPKSSSSPTGLYKLAKLGNGLRIKVPDHIVNGEKIIINTTNFSFISSAL